MEKKTWLQGAQSWHKIQSVLVLTRSLPRDVYIRRQNDHPGGQGRIYTSHLNFVSTHLSKPRHRRGCCCLSPRCLLRQFVDRCLLFWAFFIEKTVLLCFARFLSKWRETALWLFPDATSWSELYVWWLSLRRRSRRELFRLVESEGYEWRWIFAGRGNWWRGRLGGKWPHFCCERRPRRFNSQWTLAWPLPSSRDRRYECTSIVASETLRVSCQEKSQAGALCQNVGKITIIHLKTLEGKKKKKSSPSPSLLLVPVVVDGPVKISTSGVGAGREHKQWRRRALSLSNRAKTLTLAPSYVWNSLLFDHVVLHFEFV